MSNEVKAVSFRLTEADTQRFREFAEEQGLNQAEMFQNLLNSFEMSKAKGMISDRAKEIEVFQDTINNLMSMFINSLVVNQTSEERIRETLSLELNTKDKTIADLQDREKEYKEKLASYKEEYDDCVKEAAKFSKQVAVYSMDLEQKSSVIENLQSQIKTLNSVVEEYKIYRDMYKGLEKTNTELKKKIEDITHNNTDLQAKLANSENMMSFYQTEVTSLKGEIKETAKEVKEKEKAHKAEIKSLGTAHDKEIAALNKSHNAEIEKLKKEFNERFEKELQDRIQFEKSKLQFELERALNEEEKTRMKYAALKTKYDIEIKEKK